MGKKIYSHALILYTNLLITPPSSLSKGGEPRPHFDSGQKGWLPAHVLPVGWGWRSSISLAHFRAILVALSNNITNYSHCELVKILSTSHSTTIFTAIQPSSTSVSNCWQWTRVDSIEISKLLLSLSDWMSLHLWETLQRLPSKAGRTSTLLQQMSWLLVPHWPTILQLNTPRDNISYVMHC